MGLKVGEVKLEKWNPHWRNDFEAEKRNLLKIFGSIALDIQHIGSTSVECLDAKPIIDIAVGIDKLETFDTIRQTVDKLPNYSIKQNNAPDEILIRKGPETNRTHFIHVMAQDGQRMKNSLKFRDILRSNPQLREQYSELKYDLASKFPHNRRAYTASKSKFITKVLQK